MNQLIVYEQPDGAVGNDDFSVSVRKPDGVWQQLFVFEAKVDMHDVRSASMTYFDMEDAVEVRIVSNKQLIERAVIRPLSVSILFHSDANTITFVLDRPRKLSIEINGERFSNLHLFANPIETDAPNLDDSNVLLVESGRHRSDDLARRAKQLSESNLDQDSTIYFAPGIHHFEESMLNITSGTKIYVAGGAVLYGSLVCRHAENIVIRGRGVLYLSDFEKTTYLRSIQLVNSNNIEIEGIISLDPPHYSIYIGQSEDIRINNFKSFSTRGWCDGIDMMASSNVEINDVFLRTSDDCIAIYGSRGDYYGDSRNITVSDSILWADVAHPMHIGIHGNHQKDGDIIENIHFNNIDVLEHHEPQENYWGVMAICAGDNNTVRNVIFNDIRVEEFELGQLFDVRVVWNKTYNPVPGRRIENILFSNIEYNGANENPSRIYGYDEERVVDGVKFVNVRINSELIIDAMKGKIQRNEFTRNIHIED